GIAFFGIVFFGIAPLGVTRFRVACFWIARFAVFGGVLAVDFVFEVFGFFGDFGLSLGETGCIFSAFGFGPQVSFLAEQFAQIFEQILKPGLFGFVFVQDAIAVEQFQHG